MKRILKLIVICFCFFLSIEFINAGSWSSSNNPGKGNQGSTGSGGVSGSTLWPTPYVNAIRLRVFRGSNQLYDEYFLLGENESSCVGSYGEMMVCETSSYNYSKISLANSSCSKKNVSFGCITFSKASETFSHKKYNGGPLDSYFIDGNTYQNLQDILIDIGYTEAKQEKNDVVIIEPATIVKCNNSLYFGTVVSLMNQDISYKGPGVCGSGDTFDGYAFNNLFQNMSNALKENSGSFYYTDDEFEGFGYFKYIVSLWKKDGELYIKKINSVTKKLITSSPTTFDIYAQPNCTGNIIRNNISTQQNGFIEVSLPAGTYSVAEVNGPANYEELKASEQCVIKSVTIPEGTRVEREVENEPTCGVELEELKIAGQANPTNLINLYIKYKTKKNIDYRQLLIFTNNGNDAKCKTDVSCEKLSAGCLTASKGAGEFSYNNLSCYEGEPITTPAGTAYGFCKNILTVNNIFGGITKFYAPNGQFLIQELTEEGKIQYYTLLDAAKKKLELQEINKKNIVNAVVLKQCYFLKNYSIPSLYNQPDKVLESLDLYFGDNNTDGYTDILKKEEIVEDKLTEDKGYFTGVKYTKNISYSFEPTYVKNISGRVSDEYTEDTVKMYGIVSKFDSNVTSGVIPFDVDFGGEKKSSTCEFETIPIIVDDKLKLEFRIIDTTNPFVGKNGNSRKTNANWCNGNDCKADNDLVKEKIINAPNSLGVNQEPIYKIILTPDDLKVIKAYNKENNYDNYEMYCKGEDDCVNAFIYDLKNGSLNKYETENFISSVEENYGTLSGTLSFIDR